MFYTVENIYITDNRYYIGSINYSLCVYTYSIYVQYVHPLLPLFDDSGTHRRTEAKYINILRISDLTDLKKFQYQKYVVRPYHKDLPASLMVHITNMRHINLFYQSNE